MGWLSWLRGRRQAGATNTARADFTWQSGRRYMVGDSYILPRDLTEANRIDFQHFLLRTVAHGNFAAPLDDPQSILDVGCGNGRWAQEMANLFPQARVVGLDVITPPAESVGGAGTGQAPNYSFVQGSILEGLPFADASFDFVHQRLLYGSIPAKQWPDVVQELARVTNHGGWVELVESELMEGDGPAARDFNRWLVEATSRRGTDLRLGRFVDRYLHTAQFSDVKTHQMTVPIGQYGGRIGVMMEANTLAFVSGFRGMVTSAGIASEAEYDAMIARLRKEIDQRRYTIAYYIAYGRRA